MASRSATSKFNNICVLAGSSPIMKDCYKNAATELAQEIVNKQLGLVYGGPNCGLLNMVSQLVHSEGNRVIGVIPTPLMNIAGSSEMIGTVIQVANIHEHKAQLAQNSDCFVFLPGGYEVMDMFFEQISWAQLGIHNKPIGLLNVDGFFDSFLKFVDQGIGERFINAYQRHIIVTASTAAELLQKLEEHVPVPGIFSKEQWKLGSTST